MALLWKAHEFFCRETVCYHIKNKEGVEYSLKDCWVEELKKMHESTVLRWGSLIELHIFARNISRTELIVAFRHFIIGTGYFINFDYTTILAVKRTSTYLPGIANAYEALGKADLKGALGTCYFTKYWQALVYLTKKPNEEERVETTHEKVFEVLSAFINTYAEVAPTNPSEDACWCRLPICMSGIATEGSLRNKCEGINPTGLGSVRMRDGGQENLVSEEYVQTERT
ncbi:hypothetical protein DEU56DRAFT_750247 [Suillus clintonianus]|uniref:uncharacterized protein n=1 Tax=Suillus clintonianus TaxID=1904413 RepID=UPI001B85EC3B|nr:uncharacterized protein DEU56DRAFT_750247 [Suillus clintonianus]KAG2157046.1 hypothetical protein DEU56DRAFT_750247 [Suillus clintonianus]